MQKDIKLNTEDANELEILSILIENYEDKHYQLEKPNSIDAIKFRANQIKKINRSSGKKLIISSIQKKSSTVKTVKPILFSFTQNFRQCLKY